MKLDSFSLENDTLKKIINRNILMCNLKKDYANKSKIIFIK